MIKIESREGIRKLVRWHDGSVIFMTREARSVGIEPNDKIYVELGHDQSSKEKVIIIRKVKD